MNDALYIFAASSAAGVTATVATHPLDTIVVHKQTGRALPAGIWRQPRVLYRGLGPACLQAVAIYGAMLGTYEIARQKYHLGVVAAAAVSAVPEALVKGPLETVKNLRQTKIAHPRGGLALTLARGTAAMMAREIPGNIAYFWAYEAVRGDGRPQHAPWYRRPLAAGCAAGTAFALAVYPIDSARTQIVTGRRLRDVRPTYRGFLPYLCRATSLTAVLFWAYEKITDSLARDDDRGGDDNG